MHNDIDNIDNDWERYVSETSPEEWWADYDKQRNIDMGLIATEKGGGDFKAVPQGTHMAICNMVVGLGTQDTPYGVKEQLYIRWELPQERLEWEKDGVKHVGPMSIGSFYTLSLNAKSNLRKDLEGWRGRAFTTDELAGFDVTNVLGKPCQLNVIHNENGKAKVVGVSGWPKGVEVPAPENELVKYSNDDEGQFDAIPEWLQEIIKKQLSVEEAADAEEFNDSIPF